MEFDRLNFCVDHCGVLGLFAIHFYIYQTHRYQQLHLTLEILVCYHEVDSAQLRILRGLALNVPHFW